MDCGQTQSSRESDINLYLLELKSLQEDTDPILYWLTREMQYPSISKLALDLVSAPASQAYVERVFSLCGDISARKRNRASVGLERRVFLKLNRRELDKHSLGH
jgi:hAT family C-terminal dimerisation region